MKLRWLTMGALAAMLVAGNIGLALAQGAGGGNGSSGSAGTIGGVGGGGTQSGAPSSGNRPCEPRDHAAGKC